MRPDFGPNRCTECFGAQPNPTNEPVQKVNKTVTVSDTVIPTLVSEPALTDPTAQKVVEAAQNYARAIETVKIISEQLKEAKELVAALEKQLKGNQDLADEAQDNLREATAPRTVRTVHMDPTPEKKAS
jgi:ribosomal protein L7/L12